MTDVDCDNASEHVEKNLMKPFNEWANLAQKDPNPNTQVALMMLRPLIHYACKFCDAGPVLGQIANLASIRLKEIKDG